VVIAAALLALGFLGLAQALIEGVIADAPTARGALTSSERRLRVGTIGIGVALLALSATTYALPGSGLVHHAMEAVL
jgi:hypothetical protein